MLAIEWSAATCSKRMCSIWKECCGQHPSPPLPPTARHPQRTTHVPNTKVSIIYQKLPGVPKSPLFSVPHVLAALTVEQSMELHAVGRAGEKGASASEKPADIAESLQRISRSGRTLQQRKLFTLSTDACTESALPAWAPGMMPFLNWSMTCAPKLKVSAKMT